MRWTKFLLALAWVNLAFLIFDVLWNVVGTAIK
jgi:hypothetical protein